MTDSAHDHPLDEWIRRQKISQQTAAQRLGCSQAFLSLVLNGRRAVSLARAGAWSEITGISIENFIRGIHR